MSRLHRPGDRVRDGAPASIDVAFPFTGAWLVRNSPANRVPSHGTSAFATAYAIDFAPVSDSGRTAPVGPRSLVRSEAAEGFPGFGRPVLGLPSIRYALTQRRRAAAGWAALAGNHVLIDSGGVVVALCHLQRGSIEVAPGQRVRVGDAVARCGNSGNSTEPHLHLQAIDHPDVTHADAVRLTFEGSLPTNGTIVRARARRRHAD